MTFIIKPHCKVTQHSNIILTQLSVIKYPLEMVAQMVNKSACNAGDLGSAPRLGRSLGGRHGSPLQRYSLENPMDQGAWWATVHGVRDTTERLSTAHSKRVSREHE